MTPLERAIERTRSIFGVVDKDSVTDENFVKVEKMLESLTIGEGGRCWCDGISSADKEVAHLLLLHIGINNIGENVEFHIHLKY